LSFEFSVASVQVADDHATQHYSTAQTVSIKGTARGDMCFVPYIERRIIKISATETIHRG